VRTPCILALLAVSVAFGQEADSGFELRTTLSTESFYTQQLSQWPRDGDPLSAGFLALFYPTWKLDSHWSVNGAIQVHSRPYFAEEFDTQGYGVNGEILQLNLSYTRYWGSRSLVFRVGDLSSAFGYFLTRYDSAVNPLIGIPSAYGYYYTNVTFLGLTGAELDATSGKWDLRAQFVNSSPANPRSIFDHDQYGNWAGGVGYTIRGLRVGASTYYGPYLSRNYAYYFPSEGSPHDLPATALGLDAEWGAGPWNIWGELQRFQDNYHVIPAYVTRTGYFEIRRVLNPRWYAAGRFDYSQANSYRGTDIYELVAGFRPARNQLVKLSYSIQRGPEYPGTLGNTAAIEFVFSFRPISIAKN
jgi:hypothetical protein